ncbi:hypothetical protein GCM10010360_08890 [Streptomyces nogalater]
MITGRNKRAPEDHFDRNHELVTALRRKGDERWLAAVTASDALATVQHVRQGDPLGLGHAVLCTADHVAANRSRSCSATTSSTPGTPSSAPCSTCTSGTAAAW